MADEEFEEVDPLDGEEDLGTTSAVSVGDDMPLVTPVTETVFSMLTSENDGSVIVQPAFQRRAFWDRKKKASLIESVFLGLPLPLIYLADSAIEIEGEIVRIREVVDGQQRLTSLREFWRNELVMPEDSVVEDLRGKTYAELRPSLKQGFKDYKLSTATIPLVGKVDKFELFKRLNQQSTVLSDQELRNAAYSGPYLEHIKSSVSGIRDALRVSDADYKRMKDVEFLTRLLAFERRGYDAFPNKKLNLFLNDEMTLGAVDSEAQRKARFQKVDKGVERAKTLFGELRFRPYRIPEIGNTGEWARSINRALMEVQVWSLIDHSRYGFADSAAFDAALKDRREAIVESVQRLYVYNDRFNDALQRGTTGLPNVRYRFSRFVSAVEWALDSTQPGRLRRFFSPQQKHNLWDALDSEDRRCAECGEPLVFSDTEVDHIVPFSKGGETVESNGQLLHMACNRAKGARWDPVQDEGQESDES
jgi:hypothetical protein